MRKKILVLVIANTLVALGYGFGAHTEPLSAQENPGGGSYASLNGLEIYYEIHGEGQPLVLLHGGLGGIVEFSQLLPALAETRQVIAVELQAHGHTADIDRPLNFELMADDVAALIEYLGLDNADILGYSMGGGVALQTAIRHPEVVRKLVLVSTAFSYSGIHPEFQAGMAAMNAESAQQMLETPMYQFYASVAPKVENWPSLVAKLGELLTQDYDWSEQVATVTAPTLVIAGDSDWIYPAHVADLFGLLGGGVPGDFAGLPNSQLIVLPGTTHFTILSRTDWLLPIITPFLDAPMPESE
jgi:pimeloyl-ACP methyl ester carboxylesterase